MADNHVVPYSSMPPHEPDADALLTYDEVAAEFKVAKGTLFAWVHQRSIPHVRLGPRSVRFRRRELRLWLVARSVDAAPSSRKDGL